jgi:hypothetical protein
MITTTQQPQTNYSKINFIPLEYLPHGTGEVGRYLPEVEGVLVGLEARSGTYTVKDRKTGQEITRPNSWTAHFADGSMWSWPTYLGEDGKVYPWSRFDPSIDLVQCIQQQKVIHVWKDEDNFCHLELVETTTQGINPTVQAVAQPVSQPQPQPAMASSFAQAQPPQQVAQQQQAPQTQASYKMPWE